MGHRAIPGYAINDVLKQDNSWKLLRCTRLKDNQSVLIKESSSQSQEPHLAERLESEFHTLRNIDIAGVLKAHDLLVDSRSTALVLQDPGGTLLSNRMTSLGQSLADLLKIAIQLTAIVERLHWQGIVHTQLRPDVIFLNGGAASLKLSEFDGVLQVNDEVKPRFVCVEGNLNYIAPEQTGRIDADIDDRTDLYSLGAIFYELMTGRPPFESQDPLELIHCHLARTPKCPQDINSSIPRPVSDLVLKLLQKKTDERYLSAHGVLADLNECNRQFRNTGTVSSITLARHDRVKRFKVSDRLFGRADELRQLREAFHEVHERGSRLVMVAGFSGVGKTSLIQHIRGSVVEAGGYFSSGKYDQLERSNPYSAILQAFLELVEQILTETDGEIEMWKQRLLAALGVNAQVVIDVIPELELIVGKQPPVPELKPAESQNRFNFYFQKFIGALARPQHPLVLFLDDLQWASLASMRLFKNWVSASQINGLLMIGAYRDNEVDASHPLKSVIKELRRSSGKLIEINLQPLTLDSINNIIQSSLDCNADDSRSLAACVHQKTDGNPFFARSFLRSLHEEGQLYFDSRQAAWKWDVAAINNLRAADNVVDLMARKIDRLAQESQDLIQLAACIGNRFALTTLATACGRPGDETLRGLAPMIADGLIEQQDEQILHFYHDRVQEAAYGMIATARREALHYQIGDLLFASANPAELEEQLFEIVNHLNQGCALIRDSAELRRLAELNLRAGLKAKTSTAFASAYAYFSKGVELLTENPWQDDYKLAFDLYREQAESAYLSGRFDEAERGFSLLMRRARSKREQGIIFNLRIIQHENLSRFAEAAALGREAVALFDIHFPDSEEDKLALLDAEIEAIQEEIANQPISELVQLQVMRDRDVKICMKLLMTMWAPNYISGDLAMTMLIAARMVRLSLQHGNTEESAYAYVTHAINIAARTRDYTTAFAFGQLALEVNRALDDRTARAKVNHMYSCYIAPWCGHIREGMNYSRAGYLAGIESGDFTYGGYSGFHESWHALFCGMDLDEYIEEYDLKLQFLSGYQYQSIASAHQLMLQWGRALQGETDALDSLDGNSFSEQEYLEAYADVPFFIAFFYVAKLNLCYLSQDYENALRYANLADTVIFGVRGMIWDAWLCFYHALVLTAVFDSQNAAQKKATFKKLKLLRKQMRPWVSSAPQNFSHQYELMQAEIARIENKMDKAARHYERAIESAAKQSYTNIEALANELAGKFWLQRDRQCIASAYLRDAANRYRRWGALAKFGQLAEAYVETDDQPQISSLAAVDQPAESFDIAAILKASQAISGEMIMDRLVEQLMRIVLENAGAERGILLCPNEHGWRAEAVGSVDGDSVSVSISVTDEQLPGWSDAVVNYVNHTREYLLSGDAQKENRLAGDQYIHDQAVKSVLCVPIVHQQELSAILYLENNLIPSAFTAQRVLLVQALAAQAAIALKNARLYSDVVNEISVRRQAESTLRVIAEGTASVTGEDFFKSLVQTLAGSLKVKTVFVAECSESKNRWVRTLAFMQDGKFIDNIEYEFTGTPCENVYSGQACYIPSDLSKLYPDEEGFESFLGAPALDLGGRVLGHLALFHSSDMRHLPHAESILQIFASRVGVELQRKRTQQELRDSEEKYRLLVENQTDLLVKLDQSGRLQFVSPSYCDLFALDERDIEDYLFLDQVHLQDRDRIKRDWQKLSVKPWTAQFEHRVQLANGERWLGWALKALPDEDGNIIEIIGVGRDITDRRVAEEQARQHLHTLTHTGRMQSMGEMASTLAHELNQPLTAILSFAQASLRIGAQRKANASEELSHALERIVVNAKRAGDIISHMRGFIRKDEPHTESRDINPLILQAIELVNAEMLQLEIEVELCLQQSLPPVTIDPIHIQQVILNLLRNSMEAMEQAGSRERRIYISTRKYKPDGIEFSIADTGPGLKSEIADKIFNTFVTTKPEGMGVGLSICKSIIEAHAGELVIHQTLGGGASFSFTLPVSSEEEQVLRSTKAIPGAAER